MVVRLWRSPGEVMSSDWLGGLLLKLEWSQHPLWPSRWTSAGLLAAAKGEWENVVLLPARAHGKRGGVVPARGGRRTRPLSPRLQSGARRTVDPQTSGLVWHRRDLPPPVLLPPSSDPPADPQGSADVSSRPGAVVAVPHLLRTPRVLLPEHPPAQLRRAKPLLAEPRQLPEPGSYRPDPLDIHEPVHLPDAVAGGPQFLGARPLAVATRGDPLGQVRVRVGHLIGGDRVLDRPQRSHAPHESGDDRPPRGHGRGPLPRPVGDQRRPRRPDCRI